ncbi:hypothetical protein [Longimicrobium sp.]|jgi:hypothetical protein|uniref:hypothetical protein n=1 Tax=Longimicrobium sp. TaxID=2029185 RepID=UPI002F92E138
MRTIEQERARYNGISTSEAAKRIGGAVPVSNEHVLALLEDGEIEATDVSRAGAKRPEWRFSPESIDSFMERRTKKAKAA